MASRIRLREFVVFLMLLAVPLFRPNTVRGDDDADCNAAWDEGEALRKKGDYPTAARYYERALELAPGVFGAEDDNTVAILNNLALIYVNLGQYAKAEPLYQRCRKIYESTKGADSTDVADILNNLGLMYIDMGQFAKAEQAEQQSLKIRAARLGANHLDTSQCYNNLGMVYWKTGQYARAVQAHQQCYKIRLAQLGPNDLTVADSLNNMAVVYADMSQYARAEPLYRRCLAIEESQLGTSHPAVAETLLNLGNLYKETGEYAKAEPLYQQSLAIWEAKFGPNHPYVGVVLNNLAGLYYYMGQYARAIPLYQRCLALRKAMLGADHPDVAKTLCNLAVTYAEIGQYSQAEPLYRQSVAINESRLGPNHPALADSLDNFGNLYDLMQQYGRGESLHLRALKIRESALGPNHPDVAKCLNNLADAYKVQRQYAKAEPLFQRSFKILESRFGPDHPFVARSLYNLATLHTLTDHPSQAVAETEQERRCVRRHVARTLPILSEKEQLDFLESQDTVFLHSALSLALRQDKDAKSVRLSAGWVLNGKAVAQEVLAQRALLMGEAADPALAGLIKQLLTVRSQLSAMSMAAPKPGQEAEFRRQLQELNQQEQELSRQLGQAVGRSTSGDPWVELADVRKALGKDAVLMEVIRFRVQNYAAKGGKDFWLPAHYVVWLIPAEGQGEVSIIDLGDAGKIEASVQAARKALEKAHATIRESGEAKAEKQLDAAMGDLTRLVLEPLQSHMGRGKELVISPDAALWLVPWGALPLADGKYAIEKYTIRYCVSGRDLVGRLAGTEQRTTNPVLFANPDYDLGPADAAARTQAVLRSAAPPQRAFGYRALGLSSLPHVERLPGTADEAAAIKANVGRYAKAESVVYEDQYALKGVFTALHAPRVLVLCTHGYFMPDQDAAGPTDHAAALGEQGGKGRAVLTAEGRPLENPLLRCGLLLAGCNQPPGVDAQADWDDGILTGLEIVGTDLRGTDLVVLSACETGLGQLQNGEGVAGLRQAFQLAGARAVVSTLWKIPDAETVDVMNLFFTYLSQGQSKAEALRNAQLAIIKARRAEHSAAHPFYWAAFTVTGGDQ